MTLSGQQFALPGMESMRRAEPHEQTAAQFHNRPDVFVHGRYERTMSGSKELDLHDDNTRYHSGFHAGTERSAHDRLSTLGPAWEGHSPRFYHGRVNPNDMQNTAVPGDWEGKAPKTLGGVVRHASDPGRMADQGEEWRKHEHGSYYRNDYEDKGSTSVILPLARSRTPYATNAYTPQNFQTHREAVSEALKWGQKVPSHVRAVHEATGGDSGPKSVIHTNFQDRTPMVWNKGYEKWDTPITGFTSTKGMATFSGGGSGEEYGYKVYHQPPF